MHYLPTIDLTPQTAMLLSKGVLTLQPGQWVRRDGQPGRYLRTNLRTGINYFSWVRPTDDWKTQSQRFHRACMKGFVGRYRSLYDKPEPAPLAFRRRPAVRRAPAKDNTLAA